MHRPWVASYPPGVPAEVPVDTFASLGAMFEAICRRYGDRPAFSSLGATLTWNRVDALARDFAAYLRHGAGLGRGERLAVMLPNLLQYPVVLFGALRAGCVVVNINPQYTARELEHQLRDSGAHAIVVLDHFAHTVEQVQAAAALRRVIVTRVGDMLPFPRAQIANLVAGRRNAVPQWHLRDPVRWHDALGQGAALALEALTPAPSDTAFLQYTGGTTGVPKGAILSHANMVANIEQTAAWVAGVLEPGRETAVVPLPLYHVFALAATLTFCRLGAHVLLVANPRDIPAFVRELRRHRFSVMIGVNTLFAALLDAPGLAQVQRQGVKLVVAGGMALQRAVAERWRQVFGTPLVEGYGLTEAAPIVCANPPGLAAFSGCIGLPLPSTEVAIMNEAGDALPPANNGEICVRGPQVMAGYWNMPDETAQVFHPGGWLRTGDIGTMDERGFVKLVDRKKDLIVVSGFKVYPNEIEDVAALHPGVAESAAIRAADARSQEAVKLVVVRRDPGLDAEALLAHCRQHLTSYKVPRYVVFRDRPLPKSAIGKILRRAVLAEEEAHAAAADALAGEAH